VSTQLDTRTENRARIATPQSSRDIALIDLIDRLLAGGVVLSGDITLAVADIDLVQVALRALISSVSTLEEDSVPTLEEEDSAS
jgi:hypothetical protein